MDGIGNPDPRQYKTMRVRILVLKYLGLGWIRTNGLTNKVIIIIIAM